MSGLDSLSAKEASDLYWKHDREETEPKLREEERRLGSSDWASAPYITLLRRSVARLDESRRPEDLRKARKLGIPDADEMDTKKLHWAVFDEEMRRYHIEQIKGAERRARGSLFHRLIRRA